MKKKISKKIILLTTIICIIILCIIYFIFFYKNNFISLSYDEVMEKVNNNDTFILCVSATDCTHCQNYKPKLKKIANEYDVKIYYTDVNTFDENEYNKFKDDISFDGATPVTIFFKEGKEETTATRIEGDVSSDKVINKLKKNGFINE